jgi:NADPH:quinone reductase-like Zn-dependent oxidoreductase
VLYKPESLCNLLAKAGTAMLQLGRLLDLEMYGTASKSKHELVAGLGATPIDYRSEDSSERIRELTADGVDAAFDPIGGENPKRSFKSLKRGGALAAYGFYDNAMGRGDSVPLEFILIKLWDIVPNGRTTVFYSIGALRKKHSDWFRQDLTELFNLLAQGKIKPVIAERRPLVEAAPAHELVERAVVQGKIVLMVSTS